AHLIPRLGKAAAALAVAAVAIETPRVLAGAGGTVAFAAGYAVVRLLLVALYVRARLHTRGQGRRLIDTYAGTFSFTAALWLVSIFVPGPYRFVLWGAAIGLDLCLPPFTWGMPRGAPLLAAQLTE